MTLEEKILQRLKERAESIHSSNAHWKSCQDGSYEMALSHAGYYEVLKEIHDLEKELEAV